MTTARPRTVILATITIVSLLLGALALTNSPAAADPLPEPVQLIPLPPMPTVVPVPIPPAPPGPIPLPPVPIPIPDVPSVEVSPTVVELGQSFSLRATECPGPNPVGASWSVDFQIDYLPPPQLPGAPFPGSYSVTLSGTPIGDETYVATWSIPDGSPTLGGAYRVSASCIGNELGGTFVWFTYESANLTVIEAPPAPELTANPPVIQAGQTIDVTATGCPTPPFIGADYRVEYTLNLIEPIDQFYTDVIVVPGAFGDHAATFAVPVSAPAGVYEVTAGCYGNELGGDFLVFAYAPVTVFVDGPVIEVPKCEGEIVTVFIGLGDLPTNQDDVILGTPGPDFINGRGGNDIICGLGGNDIIFGAAGNDVISAGAGRDLVFGSRGNDRIHGNAGNDFLRGGSGRDTIDGGQGSDRIAGNSGADLLLGGAGNDSVWGGSGRDTIKGARGADVLNGGSGADRISGGSGADKIRGSAGNDQLRGDGGNDRIWGGRGYDDCRGGAGNDIIRSCEGWKNIF